MRSLFGSDKLMLSEPSISSAHPDGFSVVKASGYSNDALKQTAPCTNIVRSCIRNISRRSLDSTGLNEAAISSSMTISFSGSCVFHHRITSLGSAVLPRIVGSNSVRTCISSSLTVCICWSREIGSVFSLVLSGDIKHILAYFCVFSNSLIAAVYSVDSQSILVITVFLLYNIFYERC